MNSKLIVLFLVCLGAFELLSCKTSADSTTREESLTDSTVMTEPGPTAEEIAAQAEEQRRLAEEQEKTAFRDAINSVLQADANTSGISNRTGRVSAMRNISLIGCPSDFSVAYVDHIHAWEHYAEVCEALDRLHKDENIRDIIIQEGLSRLLGLDAHPLGDATDAEKRLNVAKDETDQEISSTFEIVERIAVKYGATLPR